MIASTLSRTHKSIFTPCTAQERAENFEDYWRYIQQHSGDILEEDRDLTKKKAKLEYFKANPVRSRKPLADPELFYRNYVKVQDDLSKFDRKTLLLTCIYKFARHEWVGICGAWDTIPTMAQARHTKDRISRYHLCEEFCHVRYFAEMLRTFHLDKVEWVPLGPFMSKVYTLFPKVPESLMSPLAAMTELMGITFYQHTDKLLDEVFDDEPEARDRVRELLYEIMVDEIGHIGQRRNYIGSLGIRCARWMVKPLFKAFFADLPESKYLFDVNQMVKDGLAFNYSGLLSGMIEKTWIPSYLRVSEDAA